MVSLEDFKKFELRTAVIQTVNVHPNADKLYVLGIKVGDIQKTIVAGVRAFYREEELVGKTIVVINNLEPAVIRGVESQGMMLAASDGEGLSVVSPERPIRDGATVR